MVPVRKKIDCQLPSLMPTGAFLASSHLRMFKIPKVLDVMIKGNKSVYLGSLELMHGGSGLYPALCPPLPRVELSVAKNFKGICAKPAQGMKQQEMHIVNSQLMVDGAHEISRTGRCEDVLLKLLYLSLRVGWKGLNMMLVSEGLHEGLFPSSTGTFSDSPRD